MQSARYHIIVDLQNADPAKLNDAAGLESFLGTLPGLIGMSILHGPVVKEGIPENPGITGFVIIDYSHISVHTFTMYNEALIDIFSCKPYDQDAALKATLDYFGATGDPARLQVINWG
jgi:S-adenosylmethionine decarboxylase